MSYMATGILNTAGYTGSFLGGKRCDAQLFAVSLSCNPTNTHAYLCTNRGCGIQETAHFPNIRMISANSRRKGAYTHDFTFLGGLDRKGKQPRKWMFSPASTPQSQGTIEIG